MKKLFSLMLSAICFVAAAAQQWALVNIPVANIRTTAANSSELSSQELMGMPVKLSALEKGWWKAETPDGYIGFLRDESVAKKSAGEMAQWRKAPRLVVATLEQIDCYDSPTASQPRNKVTDLVPNSIVEGSLQTTENGRVKITLPDGRTAWAPADAFVTIEEWAAKPFNPDMLLSQAYQLIGTPYLWGGASTKALDCSGLAKTCYLKNGIFLRRDASMQAKTGKQLDYNKWQQFKRGDLLFFGNKATGKVTHVAIYDGDGIFVHSTGTGDRVRINSVDPASPLYAAKSIIGAVRINGAEGTDGIVKAANHPWLF